MVSDNFKIYYVHVNGNLRIDTPWYREAVGEYNAAIATGKRGDRITISVENPHRREFTTSHSTLKLLAGVWL